MGNLGEKRSRCQWYRIVVYSRWLWHFMFFVHVACHVGEGAKGPDPAIRYSSLPDKLCEKGWFGQKTKQGWYKYDPASPRKPLESPETTALIDEHRKASVRSPRRDAIAGCPSHWKTFTFFWPVYNVYLKYRVLCNGIFLMKKSCRDVCFP